MALLFLSYVSQPNCGLLPERVILQFHPNW